MFRENNLRQQHIVFFANDTPFLSQNQPTHYYKRSNSDTRVRATHQASIRRLVHKLFIQVRNPSTQSPSCKPRFSGHLTIYLLHSLRIPVLLSLSMRPMASKFSECPTMQVPQHPNKPPVSPVLTPQKPKEFSLLGMLKKIFNRERKMSKTKGWTV